MTGKRCTDCRYTRGIGFDFWCGEGHTEYEVFGAETNCPYYEYHDWSKGVPSRIAKRFTIHSEWRNLIADIKDTTGEIETLGEFVDLLNGLYEEKKELLQFKEQVFNLIDKKLEKDKQEYEMTYEDYLNGRIEVLEELRKELLDG